ncbi:discoidin domain-containing protein [Paenibacillus guangzhouensis]|uniref:discoidin domain-containing protein n=1 Tax=Paenibacillus guangzhouensis TaxID=1473112 RepID=UPI00187B8861|nr:discoidin domain-containing protein [Paenibacillus guangzhouensis]
MLKISTKFTSSVLATAMLFGSFMIGFPGTKAYAQQITGSAPFINSWLVSGPFDSPVADNIYACQAGEVINLAPLASEITASSSTLAVNPVSYVVDGSTKKQWVTENDSSPWVNLKWKDPIAINEVKIAQWGDSRHVNNWYHLTFTLEDGSKFESGKVNSTSSSSAEPTVYTIQPGLKKVVEMKVEIDKGRTPYPSITGISEIEVYQHASTEQIDRPMDGNWARAAIATSSSTWKTGPADFPTGTDASNALPNFAIDGDKNTNWISQMHDTAGAPSTWPKWDPAPTLYLTWKQPIKVKRIEVFDRYNSAWPPNTSDVQKVNYTLKDASGNILKTGVITDIDPLGQEPGAAELEQPVNNVAKVELLIVHDGQKILKNVGLGFTEVNIFDGDGIIPPENQEPVGGHITPKVGEMIANSKKWEYFDDRLWNRNYDDYQDLYGYFTVKKGVDTRNKYVYAHTYIYSPVEQQAYFNVGASGSYRLYVNDRCVSSPTTPVELQKDLTKQAIQLKQGWNKMMIQIKHTFTEDVNANNVPIGADQNVAYLGFYGRVTDQNGNRINGIMNSVEGDASSLKIVSQGLSTEDAVKTPLPTQNMPIGYKEWPYVWNKSKTSNKYGVAASAFQFMASGGAPGYTWSIVEGKLPEGLELKSDGTIADGLVNGNVDLSSSKGIISMGSEPGDYPFTVQVTDKDGNKATKKMTITVKERPNKWFEEGRVGALSHTIVTYPYFVDPNFSADLWAERAKRQGHSLVSIEALQQNYYWPSKFADPQHERQKYYPKDENGKVIDGLKQFEEAVKRYGMKFGLYYATEGGGLQHYSTDVFVQNVEDLIKRYDPAYLYFDGPQAMPNANYDVMYSNVRNYSDDIIINSNAWGEEYGDPDLRTAEASHIYANTGANHLVKRTPMEPWKSVHTKNNYTPYYAKRDDYRQVAKEMIMNAGRGYVDNNDQMPLMSRGTNWDSPEDVTTRYPKSIQEFIDVREGLASWFAPEGKPERHESTTGTMPYYLADYGYVDDGKGNYEKFAFPNGTTGPQWGYATSRDNNVYLHIMKGPDGKKGLDAIAGKSLTIRPVKDHVTSVTWLNENVPVTSFIQTGDSLTINLTNVQEDAIDTIIKIETDNPNRNYKLSNVNATGEQVTPSSLQIHAEGYMTFPALKAPLSGLTYQSANPSIAAVNGNGIVTPVSNGTTTITVHGTYEGVTKQDTLKVTARDGKIYVGESMIGATLLVNDKESYGEFRTLDKLRYQIEGRSVKGGAIGLDAAQIVWHGGIVDLKAGDKYKPVVIQEVNTFTFNKNEIITPYVEQPARGVIWADVTQGGKTFTTNKIFMDLLPYQNLAKTAEITASHNQAAVSQLVDGKAIDGIHIDQSKWSVAANEKAWVQFKLPKKSEIASVNINFNSLEQNYVNTPKTIKIQTSEDGTAWKDVSTVNGPTGNAYFGFYNQYPINTSAQYVKLVFDGGSNGTTMDLLEVAVNGIDASNMFDRLDYEFKTVNQTSGKYDIKAYTGAGNLIDKDIEVAITSGNPNVITVDPSNLITAVSEGMAKIKIRVTVGGRSIEKVTYLYVDKTGQIYQGSYLDKINVALNKSTIQPNEPIVAAVEGLLNTGEKADLSRASVEYQLSDKRLSVVEGSNTLVVKGDVGPGFKATVAVKVILDGVTVISDPITITATGNIVPQSQMTATATSQETSSENNTASMAIDGNPQTIWHTKWDKSDVLPQSITLNLGGTYKINKITYLPRQSGDNGKITGYNVYVSTDGVTFTKVASGNWANDSAEKTASLTGANATHVKLEATAGVSGWASAAEINVFKADEDIVKSIVDYKSVAVDTNVGVIPVLPVQVEAVYNDGTTGLVDVVWEPITKEMVAKAGVFTAQGTVVGSSVKAKATYRVTGQLAESFTLSLNQPSYNIAIGDTHQSVVTATYKDSGTVKDVTSLAVFATADGTIAAIDHKGVVTGIAEGSTTISASYGGETVTAQVHVTKNDVQQTAVKLTGPASVMKGDPFIVRLGLKQVQEPIFAQDMMIQYDPKLYEFKDAVAMRDGLTVYTQPSQTPGQLRLIIASLGSDHAVANDADVVELKFVAKQVAQSTSGSLAVTSATIGDAEGQERQALPASVTVEVTAAPALPGDVNQDGKYSIADLAMAAAHYGMTQQHPDWSKFKTADVDGNGVIDIVDLAAIAKKIIEA